MTHIGYGYVMINEVSELHRCQVLLHAPSIGYFFSPIKKDRMTKKRDKKEEEDHRSSKQTKRQGTRGYTKG